MHATSLTLRCAGPHDLPALIELYQHLNAGDEKPSPPLAQNVFERFLAYAGSAIVAGEVDGLVVASCTLVVVPNLTRGGRPYGLIENVVTHADWRNRGFGRQVLNHAAERAWQADCYKVMLMTSSKQGATLDFYLASGFEQTKTGFQIRCPQATAET